MEKRVHTVHPESGTGDIMMAESSMEPSFSKEQKDERMSYGERKVMVSQHLSHEEAIHTVVRQDRPRALALGFMA